MNVLFGLGKVREPGLGILGERGQSNRQQEEESQFHAHLGRSGFYSGRRKRREGRLALGLGVSGSSVPVARLPSLERYIPVLLGRVFVPLGFQHLQRLDQLFACLARLDDSIHESAVGGDVGVGEAVAEFLDL